MRVLNSDDEIHLIGRAVEMLVPPQVLGKHTEHRKDDLIGPRVGAMGTGMDNA